MLQLPLAATFFNRAIAHQRKGDFDRAIVDFTEAIRIEPDHEAFCARAIAYQEKGDLDHAIADYTETLRLKPDEPIAFYNRAMAYHTKGDFDRAIADYTLAIRLRPDGAEDAVALFNRGRAWLGKRAFREAFHDFRHAISLKDDLAEAAQKCIEEVLTLYYNFELQHTKNNNNGKGLTVAPDHIRKLIARTAETIVEDLRAPEGMPFPLLPSHDVKAIVKHGKANSWDDRQKRGWPYHCDAFKYLHVTYGKWIPGLTREHLAAADKSLSAHLRKKICTPGTVALILPAIRFIAPLISARDCGRGATGK